MPAPRARLAAGFTLLELLVVMVIIGGLVAIVAPSLNSIYTRVRLAYEQQDVERQLLVLPAQVRRSGRSAVLTDSDATGVTLPSPGPNPEQWQMLQLDLPQGWSMRVSKPIIYHFTGACEGGDVTFTAPSLSFAYSLVAPLCRPLAAHAGQS